MISNYFFTQVLFLIGGIAISIGIITYSYKVMDTVGSSLMKLSPITAFIVVLSESIVLFIFSSEPLEAWLVSQGLPSIPLVPVSSSQAVVGAVVGIGLIKSHKQIRFKVLGEIATGWVTTPIIAGLLTFVFLFFLQNVFNQKVYTEYEYYLNHQVVQYVEDKGISTAGLAELGDQTFENELEFYDDLKELTALSRSQISEIISASKVNRTWFDPLVVATKLDTTWLSRLQYQAVREIADKKYTYRWQLEKALAAQSKSWAKKPTSIGNKSFNKSLKAKLDYLYRTFEVNNSE